MTGKTTVKGTRARAVNTQPEKEKQEKKLFSLQLIRKNNYKDFGELTDPKRTKILSALNYIEMLASTTGTDISNWDIFDTFGEGSKAPQKIVTGHGEINQIFFKSLEKQDKATPTKKGEFSDVVKNQIDRFKVKAMNNGLQRLKNEKESWVLRAKQHEQSLAQANEMIYNVNIQIDSYKPSDNKMSAQIQQIIDGTFWTFVGMEGDKILLSTTNDIIVSGKDRRDRQGGGDTYSVNFGQFIASLDLARMHLRVLPFKNNLLKGCVIHPHINNGNICWGNASETANRMLQEGDVINLAKLLAALLTTYNDSAPYVGLGEFSKIKKKMTAKETETMRTRGDY